MQTQIVIRPMGRGDACRAFTLVEIMIVVAVITLLASIAVPSFLRARKRAEATYVKNDLRILDNALDLYAIENNKASGATVKIKDLRDICTVVERFTKLVRISLATRTVRSRSINH